MGSNEDSNVIVAEVKAPAKRARRPRGTAPTMAAADVAPEPSPPQEAEIRIGCAGWALPAAVRERFPAGASNLQRYAAELDCVEINSSFYRPHRISTYARWADSVPASFRFSVKMPRTITHQLRLVQCDHLLGEFLAQVSGLGSRLGCLLVQLPPSLAFDADKARAFIRSLRSRHDGAVALEPRHVSWFGRDADALLREHRVSRVAADPAMNDAAAAPGGWPAFRYYRQHGSAIMYRSNYEGPAIAALAVRVMAEGAPGGPTWCIFDNTAAGHATSNALDLRALVARTTRG